MFLCPTLTSKCPFHILTTWSSLKSLRWSSSHPLSPINTSLPLSLLLQTPSLSRTMAGSSSISPPNFRTRTGRTDTSLSLSSASSSSSFCSLIFTGKKKVSNGGVRIQSALHSPSVLHFPKQNHLEESSVSSDSRQPPKWNVLQRALAMALDMFEVSLISKKLQNPLPKTSDPRIQLAGNFAPVPEQSVQENLPVAGTIPDCISGVYLRNGANPLFEPIADHHFFDGDGMIHAVKIKSGNASYACRFTETQRLIQERAIGRPIFPKAIGELHGHSGIFRLLLFYTRALFGLVDHRHGSGVANAGLVYFNRRLLAMSEDDLPYHVHVSASGDLETIGQYDFNDQLKCPMIAHPKLDPDSGELFALSYNIVSKPYLKFFRFSPDGKKSPDIEIPLEVPIMMHDFAITENFVVIPDQQVVFKLQEMFKGGSPLIYDKTKNSGFGILPKNAQDSTSIIWVNSPEDTFCFHLWNAWEEPNSDEVVVIGSCMTPADAIFNECDESLKIVLSEIRLNFRTGESSRRPILSNSDEINLEAGMVNKNLLGKKTQFAYLAVAEPWPKVSGFAKVDLFTGKLQKYIYGDWKFGGEPFFLPREANSKKEDDGYILCFVHDEKTGKSELQIIDAIDLELQASVTLPSRVPYGFHGTFVDSESLENQAPGDERESVGKFVERERAPDLAPGKSNFFFRLLNLKKHSW